MSAIDTLVQNFEKFQGDLKATLDTQAQEIKQHGESSKATAEKVDGLTKQLADVGQEIKAAQERMKEMETELSRPGRGADPVQTIGAKFVESEEYKETVRQDRRSSDIVQVGSFFSPRAATLTTGDASGGEGGYPPVDPDAPPPDIPYEPPPVPTKPGGGSGGGGLEVQV